MKKISSTIATVFTVSVLLSGCSTINAVKAKIGLGQGDPSEHVEIVASSFSNTPLNFGAMVIPEGVYIGGIDVGNLTEVVAYQKIKRLTEEFIKNGEIPISLGDDSKTIKVKELKLQYKIEKAIQEAFSLRSEGTFSEKLQEKEANGNIVISLEKTYDKKLLEKVIEELGEKVKVAPVDDTIVVDGSDFKIKEGKPGKGINEKILQNQLMDAFDKVSTEKIIAEVGKIEQKKLKEEDIKKLTGIIGSAVTYYNEGDVARSNNVKRSVACLNNLVIMPGQTISFNALTDIGGYEQALVIGPNEEVQMGIGGGVCQSATTFFQASVRSGMTIVESHNHSQPSNYTKLALDAMVSGWSDVKIRNDFDFPVIIRSYAQGGEVYVEYLGDVEKKNYAIDLVQGKISTIPFEVEEINDPSIPAGKEVVVKQGSVGYRVGTYIANGKTGETYKLRDNYYPPLKKVVKVNKKGALPEVEDIDAFVEEYIRQLEMQEAGEALP